MKLILTASMLMPVAALAQAPTYSPQNAVGLWIPRGLGLFPGQTAPVYLGTARFASDGSISGTPLDHNSSPVLGVWYATGNLGETAFTFVSDTYDSSGNFVNTHRVRCMMVISPDGLSATGRAILDVFDTTGKIVQSGTSTFTAVRIVATPF
jgi:hypothetical protein